MVKLVALTQALLSSRLARERGQTMAEYAVILSVITVAVLAALLLLSGNIGSVINRIADVIK
jgi:Flp pilus assembly pilin Flp